MMESQRLWQLPTGLKEARCKHVVRLTVSHGAEPPDRSDSTPGPEFQSWRETMSVCDRSGHSDRRFAETRRELAFLHRRGAFAEHRKSCHRPLLPQAWC